MSQNDDSTLAALRRQMKQLSPTRVTPAIPVQRVLGLTISVDDAGQASIFYQRQSIDGAECRFIAVGADQSADLFLLTISSGILSNQVDIVAIAPGVLQISAAETVFRHLLMLPGRIVVIAPPTNLAETAVATVIQREVDRRRRHGSHPRLID